MSSTYPTSLDTLATDKTNASAMSVDHPAHHNDLADAVNKIEAELGITPSAGFTTVAARLNSMQSFNVKDYGAAGDGVADDTAEIQAAIDAVPAAGGIVEFPTGIYLFSSTLNLVDRDNVLLRGEGAALDLFSALGGNPALGSVLRWHGANSGTAIDFGTTNGASTWTVGGGMIGLAVNGNAASGNLPTTLVRIRSLTGGLFINLQLKYANTCVLDIGTENLTGTEDTQACLFDHINIHAATVGTSADGIRCDSAVEGGGNVSCNTFGHIQILHANGRGWYWGDSDSNIVNYLRINRPSGSGIGVEFDGSNHASSGYPRGNLFMFMQPGEGGVTSRGTGFSKPAANNTILCYSIENLAALPTIETGSTLYYCTDRGDSIHSDVAVDTLAAGTTPATTGVIRIPNDQYLYARNAANSGNLGIFKISTSDVVQFDTAVRFGANITVSNTFNITFSQSTGTKIGTNVLEKIGFWNATPVARPSAYTQTYSTADKTHAAHTAAALTNANGTADTTIADVTGSFVQATLNNNFRDLSDQHNALLADLTDLKQLVNSLIDDLQAVGIVG